MSKDIELLNSIYQNAKMGIVGIRDIIDYIEDESLKKTIQEQLIDYEEICEEAIRLFIKLGKSEKDVSTIAKIMSHMYAINKLRKSHSNTIIAKMMIQGNNKGIIEISEKLNNITDCDKKIYQLGQKLLRVEEHNLEELKKYL